MIAVLVGYARLGRHMPIPANDHVLHLEALAVSPRARRSGIGSLLVEATISEAHRRGARKIGLRALSTNSRAIRLYERHGFREEARLRAEICLTDGSFADDVWFACSGLGKARNPEDGHRTTHEPVTGSFPSSRL